MTQKLQFAQLSAEIQDEVLEGKITFEEVVGPPSSRNMNLDPHIKRAVKLKHKATEANIESIRKYVLHNPDEMSQWKLEERKMTYAEFLDGLIHEHAGSPVDEHERQAITRDGDWIPPEERVKLRHTTSESPGTSISAKQSQAGKPEK